VNPETEGNPGAIKDLAVQELEENLSANNL